MDLRPGAYVTAGHGVMALVDTDTLRVEGYFEETKLSRIHVGDPVRVRLMGDARPLSGHVESIAAGIEDRDAPAAVCSPTSTRPSTGYAWPSASPSRRAR